MSNDGYDRCLMCGVPVPEGRQICPECEWKYSHIKRACETPKKTCETPNVTLKIGDIPVDPCVYKEVETIHNATVHVLRCKNCGKTEIEWERNEEDD